jgi:hypothetical protein
MLEGASVEVMSIFFFEVPLPCRVEDGQWEEEHDEHSADASRVCDEDLRLSVEQYDYNHRDRNEKTPDPLYDFPIVLDKVKGKGEWFT